jgi:SAM-dependent methyltransferase
MDEPCSYEDFRACLRDLNRCNRLTLAHRPTLSFLDTVRRGWAGGTLRIVDVGCGGGDMLRAVERWARRHRLAVRLVGIDINPYAARAAREWTGAESAIEWVTGDAYCYAGPVDVVLSSLFAHHLEDEELVRFLRWMEATARVGWFVNDLVRERVPHDLFRVLAGGLRWHRFVRHDGPVSFRRALREEDWKRLLVAAGVDGAAVQLKRWTPGRLCLERLR